MFVGVGETPKGLLYTYESPTGISKGFLFTIFWLNSVLRDGLDPQTGKSAKRCSGNGWPIRPETPVLARARGGAMRF